LTLGEKGVLKKKFIREGGEKDNRTVAPAEKTPDRKRGEKPREGSKKRRGKIWKVLECFHFCLKKSNWQEVETGER